MLNGKTLHVSAEEIEEGRRRDKFTPMGTPAGDWIGVPLIADGQVIGSLTIQSYKKGVRYEENDVQLLEFVAQHIAVASYNCSPGFSGFPPEITLGLQ